MKKFSSPLVMVTAAVCLGTPWLRAAEIGEIQCLKSTAFLAPVDSPEHRKYAPDRDVIISHMALDMTPDFKKRSFEATEKLQFKANLQPVRELSFDSVDLTIRSVTSSEEIQAWHVTADKLIVTFAKPLAPDKEANLTIAYFSEPTHGIYFRTPEMGYKEGDTHLFSNGEPIDARNWYPCFDAPNAKFTTEMTCRVPEGMTAVSNGRLVSSDKDPATGLVAFHWAQEKPHANYLVSLSAGYFKSFEDRHRDVPLAYLVPTSESKEAMDFFRNTPKIMDFFEKEIGISYPWAKYDQICLNDFMWGGMENTSATLLTDSGLFSADSENIHDGDGLIAHEMAHQWFGDLVTCHDWSDIWLNEGFATFYALLYEAKKFGKDAMLMGLYENARGITSIPNDTVSIVRRTYGDPNDIFGQYSYLPYPKGAWVLQMLRSQLGEDLYRRCIRTYLERHQYGSVVTEDLRRVIEELSGRAYDQFFDQWVYHAHNPELEVTYNWDEKTKLAKVAIKQVQKMDENVVLFNFPLTIRFKGKFGKVDKQVQVKDKTGDFEFVLDSAPELVRIDPDQAILAKTTFRIPTPMLYTQLAEADDVVGRAMAIEQLSEKRDLETISKLKHTLNHDGYHSIRSKAAQALRTIGSDEALAALVESTKQSDARVRNEVVNALAGFYKDAAFKALLEVSRSERNPVILAAAIRGLGAYANSEVHGLLVKYINSESYRNQVAESAIEAMNSQDDPAYIAPLMDAMKVHEKDFRSGGTASGLRVLGYLARNEERKDSVREFLMGYVNDKRQYVQSSAISALGTLGDSKVVAALQVFAYAKNSPAQAAAQGAVAKLRAGRKPVDDFKNLRQEVTDLEKANKDLRKDLDDLKKQVTAKDANTNAKAEANSKTQVKGKSRTP